jgi:PAS domain S-box-containing protein
MTRRTRRAPRAGRKRSKTIKTTQARRGAMPGIAGKAVSSLLWEANPASLKIIGRGGKLIDINPAGLVMVEAKTSQVVGADFTLLVGSEDRETCRRAIADALAGKTATCEFAVRGLKGAFRQVKCNLAPLRNGRGRITACLAISLDVTELKRIEKRARDSEARYRDLVDGSSDWIWEMGPDLRFTYISDQIRERAGLDPALLLGRSRLELGVNGGDESLRKHHEDLEARRPFRDFVYATASPNARWLRVSGKPIFDDAGNFLGYRGVGADISAAVEARRKAEEFQTRFREAIEAVDSGFALWNADDALVVCNAGYGNAFPDIADLIAPGIRFEELLRAAAGRGMYAAAPEAIEAYIAERLARHHAPEGRIEQHLSDGRWIQINERRAAGGGTISAWTDITELKRREQALQQSEERFALAVRGMNDGIWDWNIVSDVVFRSERLGEMFGHDKSQPISENSWWLVQIHPDDVEGYKDALRRHFKSSQELFVHEYRLRHAAGDIRWVLDRAMSRRDGEGRVVRMTGSVTDITERKHMEMQLREAHLAVQEKNRQLSIALDNMSQGLTLFDAQDELVLANRRYQEMYGLAQEMTRPGTTVSELVAYAIGRGAYAVGVASAAVEARRETARSGQRRRTLQHLRDGTILEVIHQPLPDGAIVSTFSDVTEQDAREAMLRNARETAEAASRAKSAFLANMSHELRTPLNAIIGFSEVMKGEMMGPLGSDRYRGYANDIHGSGKHLLQLINDVLDISKIEAGKAELRDEQIDLGRVIDECASLIAPQAAANAISIKVDVPNELPGLRGDTRAIKQVLLNLLSNAVKFTPARGKVALSARLGETGDLEIAVADTGIGIAKESIERIFEPFYQVDSDLSRRFEGTGLGLSLVKGLVGMHGGTIGVQSVPEQGTTFTIVLPAARVAAVSGKLPTTPRIRRTGNAA